MKIMRTYFSAVGIDAEVFDECIWRSLVSPDEIIAKDFELVCRRVEFGERVTYEVFALPRSENLEAQQVLQPRTLKGPFVFLTVTETGGARCE